MNSSTAIRKQGRPTGARPVEAADAIAETAMSQYHWERRGILGRLVRTPIRRPRAAAQPPHDQERTRRAA